MSESEKESIEIIAEAIKELDQENKGLFTIDGLPKVENLEALTGIPNISSDMRGKALALIEAEKPVPSEVEKVKPKVLGENKGAVKEFPAKSQRTKTIKELLNSQEKVEVLIPSTETEKDDVTPSIGGYVYQIKRDKWVKVPLDIVRVLDDAKQTIYEQRELENKEGMELVARDAQRIPFQRR